MKKHRVIVASDFPPVNGIPGGADYGEPHMKSDLDDIQSMIRFLLYANEFTIAGLVASSGTLADIANKNNIIGLLDRYEMVEKQLRSHDPGFPSASYLKSITVEGRSGTYGKPAGEIIGSGRDSEASEFFIRTIDQSDEPTWVLFWGGPCDLAQAIWKVETTRSAYELERFIRKLRLFFIDWQDGTAQWLIERFPKLFTITCRCYNAMADRKVYGGKWIRENIIAGHGPLGEIYPLCNWQPDSEGIGEGDTPSFLHLLGGLNGLNDPEQPAMCGWGGKYDEVSPNRFEDKAGYEKYIAMWREDFNQDFAKRMDWCVNP